LDAQTTERRDFGIDGRGFGCAKSVMLLCFLLTLSTDFQPVLGYFGRFRLTLQVVVVPLISDYRQCAANSLLISTVPLPCQGGAEAKEGIKDHGNPPNEMFSLLWLTKGG
jgi:hypothetical protein